MIRAELYRPDAPGTVVAVATWAASAAHLETTDGAPAGIEGLFRPTPVVVDDASLRRLGSHGAVVLEPGSLEWFRAALLSRAGSFGLSVRFVTDEIHGGWDPAAHDRSFEEQSRRQANS